MKISKLGRSIGTKLSLAQAGAVLLVLLAFAYVLAGLVGRRLEQRSLDDLKTRIDLVGSMIGPFNESLEERASGLARVFASRFPEPFRLDDKRSVDIGGKPSPALVTGASPVNLDFSPVDAFTAMTGAAATVFAWTGDDFIRVTTSLKNDKGERAIGTLLGRAHPAFAKVSAGEVYVGKAKLFGRDYMTRYDPIRDASGKVIGLLFVGQDFTDMLAELKDTIRGMRIGETGAVYVLDASAGQDRGAVVIHGAKENEGRNLLAAEDASGARYVERMLEQGKGIMVYPAQDAAGGSPRDVAVAFTSYPAWRWSIVGGSYLEEFTRDSVVVRNWCVAAALGVVALLVGLLALLARRWISRPLAAAIQATDRIAAGDLTATIAIDSRDEVGRLLAAMHKMQTVLTGTVRGIQQAAHHVDARAGEIAGGSSDLASRTDEQAASLEETAANVEEISASMKQNADGALRAQRLASEASEAARRGGEMSARVAATMESIEASSRKITEIVSVIDGIAFQTNILALNAAVEAARAGEHGRGFAVVATEVRSLAQRSAEAAREIDALITDSTARVRAGSALVRDSNQANETILAAVARVADVVEHISRTTGEQSLGIDEIRSAMTQLEQVTSQNATLVRETADAAASLEEQASELSTSAASFRVSGEPAADAPPTGRADRAGSQPLASASLSPRGGDRARSGFPHGSDRASDSDRASPSLGA